MAQVPAAAEGPIGRRRGGRAITTEGQRRKEGAIDGAGRLVRRADEPLVARGKSMLVVRRPPRVWIER